jgi:(1->4)-alpha-D-glucan 1-alpha-D-glucosylmutase
LGIEPNAEYEQACADFLGALLDPARARQFIDELHALVESIAPAGAVNGLAQTLIKLTAPGVPDIYQGCEFWDFSFVDPDNRRPVDFAARQQALHSSDEADELFRQWRDGRIKQRLIGRVLAQRAQSALFDNGDHLPIAAEGSMADHLFAFARRRDNAAAITVTVRFASALTDALLRIPSACWGDTRLLLPAELQGRNWRCLLNSTALNASEGFIEAAQLFPQWPVALLIAE